MKEQNEWIHKSIKLMTHTSLEDFHKDACIFDNIFGTDISTQIRKAYEQKLEDLYKFSYKHGIPK